LFISDCWRRSGTTSGAMRTALPRTIVVLSSLYIIMATSYEYKDGVVPLLLVFRCMKIVLVHAYSTSMQGSLSGYK